MSCKANNISIGNEVDILGRCREYFKARLKSFTHNIKPKTGAFQGSKYNHCS